MKPLWLWMKFIECETQTHRFLNSCYTAQSVVALPVVISAALTPLILAKSKKPGACGSRKDN